MKKQTRLELEQERDRLQTENTVLSHAVQFLLERRRPNAVETVREADDGRYVYQAFDVCAPHGGILLVTFHYPDQRPLTTAHYLERYAREVLGPTSICPTRERLEHRCAVERLRNKARALQRATVEESLGPEAVRVLEELNRQ